MHKIILGLLLVLSSTIGQAQDKTPAKKKISHRKQLRITNEQYIRQLHDGALLVRLKTKKNSIAALRKIGNNKLADKLEKQQAELNKAIVAAFSAYFDFCPAYFFFSDYSEAVRTKRMDQVAFLNAELLPDTSIRLKNTGFLTAEFGAIEQDPAQIIGGDYYAQGENGLEKRTQYTGAPNMGFEALIVQSDQFIQLRKPFPYYVRTFDAARKPKSVVRILNKNLHRFYRIAK